MEDEKLLELVEDRDVSIIPTEVAIPEGAAAVEVDGKIVGYVQDKDFSPETVED